MQGKDEFNVEHILAKLTTWEKIQLLAGSSSWYTVEIPRLKIPKIKLSDGPNGVRGQFLFNSTPSNCFPCETGLASSFDVDLAHRVGEALAGESRIKKVHVLLGPTVNIQRSPLGGRGFESFSEDPHLSGIMATAYIKGVQSKGIAACIKHFVANDQETDRNFVSSEVNERALREIYLKPFQIAIKHANPWSLMTSYGRVNGIHASEDPRLLDDILRKEWCYQGLTMSDWGGLYSSFEALKAGLDLEMPGPAILRGRMLQIGLTSDKLSVSDDIDPRVRQVLRLVKRGIESDVPFDDPDTEGHINTDEQKHLLRRAASDGIVLLKNEKNLLPLSGHKKVAVIGPNARVAMTSGGGSARLVVSYAVSPLAGIREVAHAKHLHVEYAIGLTTFKALPLVNDYIKYKGDPGALLEFWNKEPTGERNDFMSLNPCWDEEKRPCGAMDPDLSITTRWSELNLTDNVDPKINYTCWLRYLASFTPDEDGDWEFSLSIVGKANLFLDEQLIIDMSTWEVPRSGSFFGDGTVDVKGTAKGLKRNHPYDLEIRLENVDPAELGSMFHRWGGIRLGAARKRRPSEEIEEAVNLAKRSDVVILVLGLSNDYESEGYDRPDMSLPKTVDECTGDVFTQDDLVWKILEANEKTVVVNQSGTPVAMPWHQNVKTLVQAFYGGNELGNGLADVLFGKVNPSGKLPLTFPERVEDTPPFPSYGEQVEERGKVLYNEGIYVGYRSYEIRNLKPLFAFGFGLSYTTFKYSDLQTPIHVGEDGTFSVTLTVTNTGHHDGREIIQVYISDKEASLPRPVKELKAFKKVPVEKGQSVDVTLDLDREALAFYNDKAKCWVAEEGEFIVHVGASSDDIKLKGVVKLRETLTWTGL